HVVIFAAGTGNPFFTTDTAAVLRGIEMNCDAVVKATQVDGVYSADPKKDSKAKRFDRLSYSQVLANDLKVMDGAAIALARDNGLPLIVVSIEEPGNLLKVVLGQARQTIIEGPGGQPAVAFEPPRRELRLGRISASRALGGSDMSLPNHDISEIEKRMRASIESLKREFSGLRTGRASANLLDPVHVMVYGARMPLNQVATVSVPEPRMISVQVWDR